MSALDRLFSVVAYLRRNLHPDFALPQLHIFLLVCQRPGITQTEIEEALGMPHGSVSRNVKMLSRFNVPENGEIVQMGYGLVRTEPDLTERRRNAVWLTQRGEEVRDELIRLME
ncbi:MAG: MarR family winged helix-turn-helix transcriptional regulator [Betaproteobacteria bacterium]